MIAPFITFIFSDGTCVEEKNCDSADLHDFICTSDGQGSELCPALCKCCSKYSLGCSPLSLSFRNVYCTRVFLCHIFTCVLCFTCHAYFPVSYDFIHFYCNVFSLFDTFFLWHALCHAPFLISRIFVYIVTCSSCDTRFFFCHTFFSYATCF